MTRRGAEAQVATDLSVRGLRATRQRIGVLRLLRRTRCHPTVAQVHRSLLREQPNLSLKTVYDALESLVECGLASSVAEGPGPSRYEAQREAHDHARCRSCGRLFDVEARTHGLIRARTALPKGFEVDHVAVTIVGLCARCRPRR